MTPADLQQRRMRALALANQSRLAKQALKRSVGTLRGPQAVAFIAGLIETEDELVMKCRLSELLLACHGFGIEALRQIAKHVGAVTMDRRVGEYSTRQRREVVHALRSPVVMPPRFRQ